jgi:hypothetical protein
MNKKIKMSGVHKTIKMVKEETALDVVCYAKARISDAKIFLEKNEDISTDEAEFCILDTIDMLKYALKKIRRTR